MGLLRQFWQTPDMRPPMGGGMPQMQLPQMPQGGAGGMMGAFSGNPQFQQQLEALMNMQGPGAMGQVGFQPPPMPVSDAASQGGGVRRTIGGSLNTGSDPNTMRLLNLFAWPRPFNGG